MIRGAFVYSRSQGMGFSSHLLRHPHNHLSHQTSIKLKTSKPRNLETSKTSHPQHHTHLNPLRHFINLKTSQKPHKIHNTLKTLISPTFLVTSTSYQHAFPT